ncbi:MAG: hypothetical protein IKU52_03105 [Clostridia bacterium]|nr:hypothetical protein [Clostridia bacterium]
MDKRKVIYFTDEQNDEFSKAQIKAKKIDENYVYVYNSLFKKFTHFFWYRVVATPIAFLYTKIKFHHKCVGREKLRPFRKTGYFMYGNHTQDIADPFIPNMINFPKTNYFIVHPNNVSIPVLGKINPSLGALPLPDDIKAYRNFIKAIEYRIMQNHCVVIYPEAHIWPYYTKIRSFKSDSFAYPVKFNTPVFCFTNTYQKSRFSKEPKIVTYIDGPFYQNEEIPPRQRKEEIRNCIYKAMTERAKKSTVEMIKYIRKEDEND